MFMFKKSLEIPSKDQALPGRPNAIPTAKQHFVNGNPLQGPYPPGLETAIFGMIAINSQVNSSSVSAPCSAAAANHDLPKTRKSAAVSQTAGIWASVRSDLSIIPTSLPGLFSTD